MASNRFMIILKALFFFVLLLSATKATQKLSVLTMELASLWIVLPTFAAMLFLNFILKSLNRWLYEFPLGAKRYSLPPGDLGWPFIGNMWAFLGAFKSKNPDSFMSSYVSRFGNSGIYKAMMFGNPSVIVTTPEGMRKVLTDDEKFKPGWPVSTVQLMGNKSFTNISYEEHKRLRRFISASVNGHDALSMFIPYIEDAVKSSLESWTKMGDFEFLTQLRKLTFKIIIHIFLSSEGDSVREALEREYTTLNLGLRAMAINLPGFAYHKALKARKNLVSTMQSVINARRKLKKEGSFKGAKDMMDSLIDFEYENQRKLSDKEIIDVLIMYLNAGHESSGHTAMWVAFYLQKHPEFFQRAKAEHEEIIKNRPPTQKGLTLKEIRKMEYTSKVIDETLRIVTFSQFVFREAISDVNINGYTIPKGWRAITWFRNVHHDPKLYPNPKEFNPSRWDNFVPKALEFIPFGAGSRLCPGNDLAKLEISVFLHHFLLNYELEQLNPQSPVIFLPHIRPKDNFLARIKKSSSSASI
ncbi:hypothetical protein L6164_017789 [Bauhinia variegata]|uniref:Uncharacterized protein n=1 Tax=Bauhinia variegata TaxID=167791 RepID=A0ACB9NAW1_BAUVA|nr:hypothetical protein L6164_017789 [Bauhinia variegata]